MALGKGAEWKNFRSFFACLENVFIGSMPSFFSITPRFYFIMGKAYFQRWQGTVSYTHLDVYKRQEFGHALWTTGNFPYDYAVLAFYLAKGLSREIRNG